MSVFASKNILVIGDETGQVHEVERELELRGAHIVRTVCGSSPATLDGMNIDFVLLNHLHDGDACTNLLSTFGKDNISRKKPIFALVNSDDKSIEEALSLGAADYFTEIESADSIIKKISLALGEPDVSGRSIIEINEKKIKHTRTGTRVYAVEDDSLLGNLLKMRLEQANFEVYIDETGQEVLEKIREFKPEIILLDLSLPIQSGFEILQSLRDESDTKNIPVIVFSNRDTDDDKERALKLGAKAFFVKVMTDFSDLIAEIERLV